MVITRKLYRAGLMYIILQIVINLDCNIIFSYKKYLLSLTFYFEIKIKIKLNYYSIFF